MNLLPGLFRRSYVKPGRHPDILDSEYKPQEDLDRQRQHDDQEGLHHHILEQAHAAINLARKSSGRDQFVNTEAGGPRIEPNHDGAENNFAHTTLDAENIRQIAVHLKDEAVVIPRHAGPEPHPSRTANQGPDDNHRYPKDDESENEGPDGELALLVGVV